MQLGWPHLFIVSDFSLLNMVVLRSCWWSNDSLQASLCSADGELVAMGHPSLQVMEKMLRSSPPRRPRWGQDVQPELTENCLVFHIGTFLFSFFLNLPKGQFICMNSGFQENLFLG